MGNTASGQPVPQPMMRSRSSFNYPTSSRGSAFAKQSDRALLTAELQRLVDEQEKERQKLMQAKPDVKTISAKISELEEKKQPFRAQLEKLPMLAGEKRLMQQRQQAMQPAVSVSGGSTTARPEQAGLLSRLGRGALDALQDPVRQAQIVTALNSIRLQPDPNLAKSMQTRAEGVQKRRQSFQDTDVALQLLEQRGVLRGYSPEQIQQLRNSPRLLMALTEEAMKAPKLPSVFQQKIDALVSTGMPRADAIRQVIEGEAAGTNINMPDPARGEIYKATFESDAAMQNAARTALDTINKSNETLSLLKEGNLNLGLANPALQFKDRLLSLAGNVEAARRASDTDLLNSMLGTEVFGAISSLGIGARGLDTPAEREFLREVLTGTTTMEPETIEKMARLRARYATKAVARYNEAVERGQFTYIEDAINQPRGSRYSKIETPELIDLTPVQRPTGYPEQDWALVPLSQKQQARDEFLRRG